MKVLMISTDRKLFHEQSAVRERMRWYATLTEELHVIVFARKCPEYPTKPFSESPTVRFYPTNSTNQWFYIFDALRIGFSILSRDKDAQWVLSAQNPFETGVVAWVLARWVGARLHMQLHTDPFSPFFIRSHFLNRFRVLMARFLLPRADSIRVVSTRARNAMLSFMPPHVPIHVFPIFVDVAHIQKAEPSYDLHVRYPQFKNIILKLSRLEPEKNIDLSIQALPQILTRFPETGLVIVGAGSERLRLEELARSLGVETHVIFAGWLDDVVSAFKTADLFVLTSKYEGYAMTLIEATAAGLPIVTTDVGLVGDILKDGESALVCPPENSACIAEKVIALLENPLQARALVASAQKTLQERVLINRERYLEMYRVCWDFPTVDGRL